MRYLNETTKIRTKISEDKDEDKVLPDLKAKIWDTAVDSVREWTGQDLTTSSLYGIRVYKSGAVLAPHVDRLPLVSSCIINVAQVRALCPLFYGGLVAAFFSSLAYIFISHANK